MPPHVPCWSGRHLVEVSRRRRRCPGPSSPPAEAEGSTMRMRRSVADIESSSNEEVGATRRCHFSVLMGIATTTIRRDCIARSEPISRGLWQGAVVIRVLGERHAQFSRKFQAWTKETRC
ncbi:hypothetical protein ACQJBY_005595 [Aegilops geniculata]